MQVGKFKVLALEAQGTMVVETSVGALEKGRPKESERKKVKKI
jgi:hypothetical protein